MYLWMESIIQNKHNDQNNWSEMWTHRKFIFFISKYIISRKEKKLSKNNQLPHYSWIEKQMSQREYRFLLTTLILMKQWEGDIADEKSQSRALIPKWCDCVDVYLDYLDKVWRRNFLHEILNMWFRSIHIIVQDDSSFNTFASHKIQQWRKLRLWLSSHMGAGTEWL